LRPARLSTECCNVLQCVAVCCSILRYVAVCGSVGAVRKRLTFALPRAPYTSQYMIVCCRSRTTHSCSTSRALCDSWLLPPPPRLPPPLLPMPPPPPPPPPPPLMAPAYLLSERKYKERSVYAVYREVCMCWETDYTETYYTESDVYIEISICWQR